MKQLLFITLCCLASYSLSAQYTSYDESNSMNRKGTLDIAIEDGRIEELSNVHTTSGAAQIKGYRVQILQDSKRDKVRQEKSRFLGRFPKIAVYEKYESPLFKLRAGDFKDRLSAYGLFYQVKRKFPRAFIVNDYVNDLGF